MRGGSGRARHRDDEEESVFVSMTDMTIGFLFIVILLLAFFAKQYSTDDSVPRVTYEGVVWQRDQAHFKIQELEIDLERLRAENAELIEEKEALVKEIAKLNDKIEKLLKKIRHLEKQLAAMDVANPLEAYLNRSHEARKEILENLKSHLEIAFPELEVFLTEESDALRFQGDGLFRSGAYALRPERKRFIETVAERLQEILPCYSLGLASAWDDKCNGNFALIEAVQIEGHTDADGPDLTNLSLSTNRANETFRVMTEHQSGLTQHLNFKRQPVLSVAGYGEMRPVAPNNTVDGKATNRRIDLRIIMYVPPSSEEIRFVRDALVDGLDG